MDFAGAAISPQTLDTALVLLLYMPAALWLGWRLIPRLRSAWRGLALVMLLAQALAILLSLVIQPASRYEEWLWAIDSEGNIPSILASMQLGLAGLVALMTAWLAKARSKPQRLYLIGVSLLFVFIGLDEFMEWKGALHNWQSNLLYGLVGAAIALGALVFALRSSRPARLWWLCLLAGLALIALGGIALDAASTDCSHFRFGDDPGCALTWYTIEEAAEFLGAWLALVAALGCFGDAAAAHSRRARSMVYLVCPLWLVLLFVPSVFARVELEQLNAPLDLRYEQGVNLVGFSFERQGDALLLKLYAAAETRDYLGLGYSIHLVDQANGRSLVQRDEWAQLQHGSWFLLPGYANVYRHWTQIRLERRLRDNRAMWIVLSLWRERDGEFSAQAALSSDRQLLDETQVILGEVLTPRVSSARVAAPVASFENGFALGSYDMPASVKAGDTLPIAFAWQSAVDGAEDIIQFLHLVHAESGARPRCCRRAMSARDRDRRPPRTRGSAETAARCGRDRDHRRKRSGYRSPSAADRDAPGSWR